MARLIKSRTVALIALCAALLLMGQVIIPGGGGGSLPVATSNMTFYASPTGSSSGFCTLSGAPCTLQQAVNVAASYNYQNLYFPTVSDAGGSHTGVQVFLPQVVNAINTTTSEPGGVINFAAPATLSDSGTNWTFTAPAFSKWNFSGSAMTFGGTYGGIALLGPGSIDVDNNMVFSGTLAQGGVYNNFGNFYAPNTWTVTTSTMGELIFTRGTTNVDGASFVFSNPVTFSGGVGTGNYVMGADGPAGYLYVFGTTFTNATNVTASTPVGMFNGSFFEAGSTTKVDGSTVTRSNFPGVSNGGTVLVDTWSKFQSDNARIFNSPATVSDGVATPHIPAGSAFSVWASVPSGIWNIDTETPSATSGAFNYLLLQSTPTAANQRLGGVPFGTLFGDTSGASEANSALFGCFSAEAYTAGSHQGAYCLLATTPTASGTRQNNFAFWGDGGMSVGTANVGTDPGAGIVLATKATLTTLANTATTSAVCYNTSTGVLTYDGTVGTCTTSDERLKNIGPRIDDALDRLLQINGFYFTWKDSTQYGDQREIGVGAQTVEKVFPELVSTGSDGIKSVAYEKLTAPIIEALRELKKANDNIKADNDNLRACMDSWRCRLFGMSH